MPLQTGFFRLSRLRGKINTLGGGTDDKRKFVSGLDFPSFNIPHVQAGTVRQAQIKPAPVDLRLRVDLRDVKLYVDVIVDMLLQSLDGRVYSGDLPQNGRLARQLGANPEARRVLNELIERAENLKTDKNLSAEEIIRMLARKTTPADETLLKLPLSLKNIAVTREKSDMPSTSGRRERLVREARKLVMSRFPPFGQGAEIVTKQNDDGSALHVIVPRVEPDYHDESRKYETRQDDVKSQKTAEDKSERPPETPRGFEPPKVEYLRDYRRENEKTSMELAQKLVDAKTLAQMSGEAAASLNRMIEQGKLAPSKGAKQDSAQAAKADTVMTYANLYPGGDKPEKRDSAYNIVIKNLYYNDKMVSTGNSGLPVLPVLSLRHLKFGRSIENVSIGKTVPERKIADSKPALKHRNAVAEQRGTDRPAMFFAETPAAAAMAGIEAQKMAVRQTQPVYAEPDMSKLKNELAKQAGKELDDIIKKKLNVDKLTDKIYHNLENRLRSERIRKGII